MASNFLDDVDSEFSVISSCNATVDSNNQLDGCPNTGAVADHSAIDINCKLNDLCSKSSEALKFQRNLKARIVKLCQDNRKLIILVQKLSGGTSKLHSKEVVDASKQYFHQDSYTSVRDSNGDSDDRKITTGLPRNLQDELESLNFKERVAVLAPGAASNKSQSESLTGKSMHGESETKSLSVNKQDDTRKRERELKAENLILKLRLEEYDAQIKTLETELSRLRHCGCNQYNAESVIEGVTYEDLVSRCTVKYSSVAKSNGIASQPEAQNENSIVAAKSSKPDVANASASQSDPSAIQPVKGDVNLESHTTATLSVKVSSDLQLAQNLPQPNAEVSVAQSYSRQIEALEEKLKNLDSEYSKKYQQQYSTLQQNYNALDEQFQTLNSNLQRVVQRKDEYKRDILQYRSVAKSLERFFHQHAESVPSFFSERDREALSKALGIKFKQVNDTDTQSNAASKPPDQKSSRAAKTSSSKRTSSEQAIASQLSIALIHQRYVQKH